MKENNKLIIIGLCIGIVIILISLFLFVSKKANKTENDYIYIKNNLSIKKKETLNKDGKQLEISQISNMIDDKILKDKYPNLNKEYEEWFNDIYDNLVASFGKEAVDTSADYFFGTKTVEEYKQNNYTTFLKHYIAGEYYEKHLTEKELKEYYDAGFGSTHIKLIKVEAILHDDDPSVENRRIIESNTTEEALRILGQINSIDDFNNVYNYYQNNNISSEYFQITATEVTDLKRDNEDYFGIINDVFALQDNTYNKELIGNSDEEYIVYRISSSKESYETSKETMKKELKKLYYREQSQDSETKKALQELRKEYQVKINDEELNKKYQKYIK